MSIDSRKGKFGYLVVGIVIGAISFATAPAIGHVGDKVGHLWEDHLFDKAKADFFTKAQANKRFFTKTQANQRFVNIGEAADSAHALDCTGCVGADELEDLPAWTPVAYPAPGPGLRWQNADGEADVQYYQAPDGTVHFQGGAVNTSAVNGCNVVAFFDTDLAPEGVGEGRRMAVASTKSTPVYATTDTAGQLSVCGNFQVGDIVWFDSVHYRPDL